MKLLSFFFIRLKRNTLILSLAIILLLIPLALTYRNVLKADQLGYEDRIRITRLKQEAETILYTSQDSARRLDTASKDHYKQVLNLATSYLDKEYLEGKSQAVLKIELELYQELVTWQEKGQQVNHFTRSELNERVLLYQKVLDQEESFHYLAAPKDFYLSLAQILSSSCYWVPIMAWSLVAWLMIQDLTAHRGLLFTSGLSSSQYALGLTLLAFLSQVFLYTCLLGTLWASAKSFHFSFQLHYPVFASSDSLTLVPILRRLQSLLLQAGYVSLGSLLCLGMVSAMIVERWKTRP